MTERLGWTLIHFVWQGAGIAALYAIARSRMTGLHPARRYALGCLALAAMMIAPLVTLALTRHQAPGNDAPRLSHVTDPRSRALSVYESGSYSGRQDMPASPVPARLLRWLVTLWLAGAIAFWLRLIAGWALASRMRTTSVRPAPPEWQLTLDELRRKIGLLRPVKLLISALVQVPTVLGWLRPVVLVPVGALTGLPPDQIEGLLFHELAHIRRHDYLVNILQCVAEAFLFYHPAVWWISGHIRAEREHCCDDIAVAATGDVITYARALAELESSRTSHFTPALAASGGSLRSRIGRLLGQPSASSRTGTGAVAVVAAAIILIVVVATESAMRGQAPARPQFEVASVKENPSFIDDKHMDGITYPSPGTYRARNMTLRWLCRAAFDINSFNIFGGPAWLDSAGFDIDAKTPVVPGQSRDDAAAEMKLMVQSLLQDRLKLKTHIETRELPVYILTIAKTGLKMKPAPCDPRELSCQVQVTEARKNWPKPVNGGWGSMTNLVTGLATMTNGQRAVIDKTGLTGFWDLHMQWAYQPVPNPDEPEESIFTVIENQLGLHLEAGKGPVEVLVIDHAEKPEPN